MFRSRLLLIAARGFPHRVSRNEGTLRRHETLFSPPPRPLSPGLARRVSAVIKLEWLRPSVDCRFAYQDDNDFKIACLLEFAVGAEEEFTEILRRAKALDPDAVERLWKACGPAVLKAIQRRVGRQTSRFDAGDVAQAVWLAFYRNLGKLPPVASQEDLVKYLEATAANKVRMEYRRHVTSRRRSVDREVALESDSTPDVAETTATASQFAMGREVWERLLNEAPSEHRRVALPAIDGRSQAEIAEELGVYVRTVQRILGRLKRYLGV